MRAQPIHSSWASLLGSLPVLSAHSLKEVTSSAIVVLTAFLDFPNLPKEGLSGLKGKFSWRDA